MSKSFSKSKEVKQSKKTKVWKQKVKQFKIVTILEDFKSKRKSKKVCAHLLRDLLLLVVQAVTGCGLGQRCSQLSEVRHKCF